MASHAPSPRRTSLRREEAAGLVVALAAHGALVAWLTLKPPTPAPLPEPERMTVTFAEQVAAQSTSPRPVAEAAPAVAPVIAENPVPEPAPEPQVQPRPAPAPVARVQPRPEPPKPTPPQPQAQARPQLRVQPAPAPAKPATPAKPTPAKPAPPVKAGGGGSRLGADFLKGLPGGQNPAAKKEESQPGQSIGQLRSSFAQSVLKSVRPHWQGRAPQGINADKIVTYVAVTLNRDGTLAGPPRFIKQDGVDDSNRAQASRHAEEAIRAIQLAAPFDLPDDQYDLWKSLPPLAFKKSGK